MSVEVIVPWRGGCPHREAAWRYVRALYGWHHPGWRLTVAEVSAGLWCKGAAVNPAARASNAEVLLLADADVWCAGLARTVEVVVGGQAEWAVPHTGVFRLSERSTAAVLAGAELGEDLDLDQLAYKGTVGGGLVVARREVFREVPLDARFTGWGQEDHAFGLALDALYGPPWRGKVPLFHLWHPPQQRLSRRDGSLEGRQLLRRYAAAHRKQQPDPMRALIEEARRA